MGSNRQRWEQEQRRKQIKNARKRGSRRHNAQNFIKATDQQWDAIRNQVAAANKKINKEKKQERRHDRKQDQDRNRNQDH